MCTCTGMCGGLVLHMAGVWDTVILSGLIDIDRDMMIDLGADTYKFPTPPGSVKTFPNNLITLSA